MSHLIVFLAIAVLFVIVLLVWALRTEISGASKGAVAKGSNIAERPPLRALAERIFAARDWEFVSAQTEPAIQRTFLQERRNVALSWLRQIRKQAAELMGFHRRAVRGNIELKPGMEMRLVANYLAFLFLCGILHVLIRLRGPFQTRKMADYAIGVSDRLRALSGQLLAGADPVLLSRVNAARTDKSS